MRAAAFVTVVLVAGCSGCGGGGSGSAHAAAISSTNPSASVPSAPPSGAWLKGDLHVHTLYSGDATRWGDTTEITLKLAERAGLDFIALTDHRTFAQLNDPKRTAHPSVIGIAGMEWNGTGHAGAIGYKVDQSFAVSTGQSQDPNAATQAVIDEVHKQGGVFVVNHPADKGDLWVWNATGYDAIEVWNGNWALRATEAATLADIVNTVGAAGRAVELERAVAVQDAGFNFQSLRFWEEFLQQGRRIAAVGGGDRHGLVMPGSPTTKVFAASRTEADILEAIRMGRTQVVRAPDGPEAELTADRDGDGVFETILGDSVPLDVPVTFKVRVVDADGGRAELIKNGAVVSTWPIQGADFTVTFGEVPTSKSWYRLDVYEPLDMSMPNASVLKRLVLGFTGQSWMNNLSSGPLGFLAGWATNIQEIVNSGGPAILWMVIYGDQVGVKISPVMSRYPTLEFPESVSRMLNVDFQDTDMCRGVITSPIWAE